MPEAPPHRVGGERGGRADVPDRLDAEARRLRNELDGFLRAIADGTAPASVMAEIRRREARLAEIEDERRAIAVDTLTELEERRLRKSFRERLAQFDRMLRSDIPLAQQALRKVIAGRIEFRPTKRDGARAYRLRWSLVTFALLGGNIGVATPRGRTHTPPSRQCGLQGDFQAVPQRARRPISSEWN